jgi:hypothetical protein
MHAKKKNRPQPLVRVRLRGFDCVVSMRAAVVVTALGALLRLMQHFGR